MKAINRVLAALLSLALVIIGVLVIIEVIADRLHHRPALVHWHPFYDWAGRTEWQAGAVRVYCVVLIVLGLALLVAELKRPRVSRLRLAEEVPGIDSGYTRRGVAAAIRSAVAEVDGVRGNAVTVGHRKVTVLATASATDRAAAEQVREPVVQAARTRLDSLQLASPPTLSARVKPRSS